jgi:triphosphoribosyl-dephospho-CoA synthase
MKKKSSAELARCARQACLLEVSAEKPGNVTPTKSFRDTGYMDFVKGAERLEPIIEKAAREAEKAALGKLIYDATSKKKNANFGIIMMLMPLAAAHGDSTRTLMKSLTSEDSKWIIKAMQKGRLGSMGLKDDSLSKYDIFSKDIFKVIEEESITPLKLMELAAPHDTIAREWVGDFPISRVIGRKIKTDPEFIIHAYLFTLSKYPDTLIARKCGMEEAMHVSHMASEVLEGRTSPLEFDQYLRAEGNKKNPGTTADLIAAGLFLRLLRD